jgi:hypothetical protein
MKRILLTSVLVPFGLAFGAGCAVDDSSGAGNTTGNTSTGSAGDNSMGTAGENNMGTAGQNNMGTAGDMTGAGGGMTTGGGNGGATNAGGDNAGGGGAGVGGSGGTGGAAMGNCTTANTAGCIDEIAGKMKSNIGFFLKDSWFMSGCDQKAGHDCITTPNCPNPANAPFEDKGAVTNEKFPIGGEAGKTYAMTFKFNGVSEGKFYNFVANGAVPMGTNGVWADPASDPAVGKSGFQPAVQEAAVANDTFFIGGSAVQSNYNVMRVRVLDSAGMEKGRYYMNGYPQSSGAESHRTFLLSYSHTIDVIGGGSVEFHIEDSNCHAIDNCGVGNVSDTVCDAARYIPNEMNATLPAQYDDVSLHNGNASAAENAAPPVKLSPLSKINPVTTGKQPWHSQISHFTVTKVVPK